MNDFDTSKKKWPLSWVLIIGMFMISISSLVLYGANEYQYNKLKAETDKIIAEMCYLVEGRVIAISEDGGTIYCVSDYTPKGYVDEVDVFDEVFCDCAVNTLWAKNCRISVGDTVLYCVDANWTDADLVAKIHD